MNDDFTLLCYLDACRKILEGNYGPAIQTIGLIFLVLVFNFFVKTILLRLRSHFFHKNNIWAWSFVSALRKPLSYFVWFIAAVCASDIIAVGFFDFHLVNIHFILSIGAVLTFGWFLLRWNTKVVRAMMERSQTQQIPLEPAKLDLLSKLATISAIFFTIFLLMDVTGRNMQTLIAFGGIGGLALAFASQQVISNFFGGFMIYITHPFTIGEWVVLPERKIEGHIEEIGWYLTRIRNFEKRPIYVPNSIFAQTVVITPSRMSHERFHPIIGLRYQDLQAVKPIVDEIKLLLLKHPHIDQRLNAEVFFINLAASTLDIEISAYVAKTSAVRFAAVRQELLLKIADIIHAHGAEIATPKSTVEIPDGVVMKSLNPSEEFVIPSPATV